MLQQVAPSPELGTADPLVTLVVQEISSCGTAEAVHRSRLGWCLAWMKVQPELGEAADEPLAGADTGLTPDARR